MTWPSSNVPATAPTTHGEVRTQAYQAGGGDYFRSGYYSHGLFTAGAMTTFGPGALNRIYARSPFVVPVRRTFDRIAVNVTTAAGAGGVLRFGIFAGSGGLPTSLILDAGTVASTSTGVAAITINQTLDPGVYYLALVMQVAACTVTAIPTNYGSPALPQGTNPINGTTVSSNYIGGTNEYSGALPSTFPSATALPQAGNATPAICLRAA